jgi:choline dehydrogenase-like flavoprotein
MSDDHYDIIVVGSGPGGAALAQRLATTGKRILILERGDYLPRSEQNWDAKAVFVDGLYQADERWIDRKGQSFTPGLHYVVGGNSKVYGSALFRLRERDFGEVRHAGGLSPAWPIGYDVFEPYYAEAEALFHVHGQRGEDPIEPWSSSPYPHPPVQHEPKVQALNDRWRALGLNPYHLPLGILLDERAEGGPTPTSVCIKCSAFDGFPCLLNGKADAQVICIDPTLAAWPNVTLLTGAYATKLSTDPSGRTVETVHVTRDGVQEQYSADIVVAACGSLSSALLLLRSASEEHPNGLANGSDQVGRNYMRHEMSVLMALMREANNTVFQKTLAVSDFYFGSDDWDYPLGLIQMCAVLHPAQIRGETLPQWLEWAPNLPFETMSRHCMAFWLQTEDLPIPENRIYYRDGQVHLDLVETNAEAARRLKAKLRDILNKAGYQHLLLDHSLYLGEDIGLSGTSHQAGTARFGTDPNTSVLNLDCRAHEVDNLYIADASFFPSIGAVNPTLTIIANALRVADHIKERLG